MGDEKLILGADAVFSTNCEETGVNNNVLVCGSSGSGKTMSVLEPILLELNQSSAVVPVTKRRLIDKYRPVLEDKGYHVEILNFVQPREGTVGYDPLHYVQSYKDITAVAEAIVKANARKDRSIADPYWDESAVSLLSALSAYVLRERKNAGLLDALELLGKLQIKESGNEIITTLDGLFQDLEEEAPDCFAVNCWRTFRQVPYKTASCIFGSLNTTVDTIFTPELRWMLKRLDTVDFQKLAKEKTVLFVYTSAVNPALNCFVNVFYAEVFKSLFEYGESFPQGRLPRPVRVLCDDFATGSRILNFPEYISVIREKQISCVLLVQSESQLETMYSHEDATTIINNCDTYLYMGGMDLRTARSVSERLNVPLEEVLYQPVGRVCIFRRGQRPIVTMRYDIRQDVRYQETTKKYEKQCREEEREGIEALF